MSNISMMLDRHWHGMDGMEWLDRDHKKRG